MRNILPLSDGLVSSREHAQGLGRVGSRMLWRSGLHSDHLRGPGGQAELDPIDDRDRVESLSPLSATGAVAIP
jgi:hypothetical protein